MGQKFDFSGWATKNDLKCSDGLTIRKDAFKDNNGQTVPLVWMHQHNDPENVLGHALLENRESGVYAYCVFNDTPRGQHTKALVEHGDVTALSIYANKLVKRAQDVIHGDIKEVSLVLAGANPGAWIEFPVLEHADGTITDIEDEATIFSGDESLELFHEEEKAEKKEPEKKEEDKKMADNNEKTVKDAKDIFDSLTDEQKQVVYFMIGKAVEDAKAESDEAEHSDKEGDEITMKHNVFDSATGSRGDVLSHADFEKILGDAKRLGSMKASVDEHIANGVLKHDDPTPDPAPVDTHGVEYAVGESTYGFNDPDMLFPDARAASLVPEWIKRDTSWVATVLNGAHHTPFSRVKSIFANITEDQARAKGYMKGKLKKDEVFSLLKRATTPQTIYKKQKMDRDDVIDITGFDVIAWIKGEMRMMLDEELARAALIGDGRQNSDDDKISEDHIRPIATDASLFTIQTTYTANDYKSFIRAAIKARKDYKGTGNPILFTTEDMLSELLLLEDQIGHSLYPDEASLARKLRVSKIVTVPVMENSGIDGIIVNMADYTFGADKGGAVSMFEDFDIDYNQQKYLIETRCSGALTRPYSAIVISAEEPTPEPDPGE